jgi:arylsulfatase A-like enzyme
MPTPTRRHFLHAAGFAAAARAFPQQRRRPNVLILLTDDQGFGDMSCHGNPVLKTPNTDKLHAESLRLTDFHSAPMCTPTRGQLMSGLDALRNKAASVTAGRGMLRRDLPTMADVFRQNGYRTGLFGKWHLGDNYPYRPMERGFETAKYHLGWGFSATPEFDNDYFNGRYHDQGQVKQFEGYCTDFWFSQAMQWMSERKAKNEPFFCYLPTNVPHGPTWVSEKYSDAYNRAGLPKDFFGMIANLDENIGKLDAFLRQSGLHDNTIVIFMTDNGATGGFNVFNAGMRGRKTQLYEGGHRVPCFVRWPQGGLRKPADIRVPAQMQDWLPTLAELCPLKLPAKAKFDGRTLAPILRSESAALPDRMLVVQYGQILKKWESTVIWNQWRLVSGAELYDFYADVGQKNDVATANREVVEKMRAHYEKWWAELEPTLAEYAPISIGSPHENPTILTSSDWQDVYCDNVRCVSDAGGGDTGAPWNLYVERGGEFEIRLFRWKPDLNHPLTASRPVQKMAFGTLPAGKGLPIAGARITVAGKEQQAQASPGAASVSFRATLKTAQKLQLHAWFTGADGKPVCGAYYASVRKL